MSRSSHVPTYCLHKPSGRAYVRIRGKVIYCGVHGTPESKAEHGRLIAEFAANPGAPTPAFSAITVVELIAIYFEFCCGYYRRDGKPTRHVDRVRLAMRPVRELYGTIAAESFGPLALRAIQARLVATGVSRKYINDLVCEVKRLFKWGVSMEMLPPSVYHALTTIPGLKQGRTTAREPKPVQPVADDLVEATLPYMPSIVADLVRVQRYTGCRPSEICQLRPCDVERDGEVWRYSPRTHKTQYRGRERIIYIGPQAQRVLAPYLDRDPAAHCFSPAESEEHRHREMRANRKSNVQPSQRNRRKPRPKRLPATAYTKDSYQRAIARAVVKANRARTEEATDMGIEPTLLPHWHANQLRHAAATEVRRKYGLEAAQIILGHAKADITQTYAERDARLAVEVSKAIG